MTFASQIIKRLSALRSDKEYEHMWRSADVGQKFQLRLANQPPSLLPDYEADRLHTFFQCWVQEWEIGGQGLAVINDLGTNLGDCVPPWNFAWTDEYLLDPSVPPIHQIKPRPTINGYQLTDELCANRGCDCEDDACDPRTCACLRRAAECYPHKDNYYQRMFAPTDTHDARNGLDQYGQRPPAREFAYDASGRLNNTIPEGTPIFECNKFCPCAKTCRNRVVQKGKKAKLAFCKTQAKGWGIVAEEELPRGTFVGAYGGELLNDVEAERRAIVYDQKLGTTYLQTVDSHILKVHLTKQILEINLARTNQLHLYRGSPENERKMVDLISTVCDQMEVYEDYFKFVERSSDRDLLQAELRKRDCEPAAEGDDGIFARAKKRAYERAYQQAEGLRRQQIRERPDLQFGAPITPDDFQDPVWRFLKLDVQEQEQARAMQMTRSDMEDEHFVTVDSALWGNHTRFFNHSCDPNIYHVPVYTHDASIMRPLLAFFTLRTVREGEELCFNYAGYTGAEPDVQLDTDSPRSPSKSSVKARIHAPTTKPGADTVAAITTSSADAANATRSTGASFLAIKCACGAKNCTGRVFA